MTNFTALVRDNKLKDNQASSRAPHYLKASQNTTTKDGWNPSNFNFRDVFKLLFLLHYLSVLIKAV